MPTIMRNSVHEAGHAVVTFLVGVGITKVHCGSIWESERGSDFVPIVPKLDGQVNRDAAPDLYFPAIKGAGAAAEIMWPGTTLQKRRDLIHRMSPADLQDVTWGPDFYYLDDPLDAIREASHVLESRWIKLVRVARYFDTHRNTTIYPDTMRWLMEFPETWSRSVLR